MPFVNNTTGGIAPQAPQPLPVEVDRDFGEVFSTAFDSVTTVGQIAESLSSYANQTGIDRTVDPEFDPFAGEAEELLGYEDVAHVFEDARNRSEFEAIKSRVDRERAQDEELASQGMTGVMATLGAGVLDPINLVPFAGEGKLLYTLSKTGKVGKMALVGARAGLYAGTAAEVVAQNTRLTQTAEQSLMNVAASTVLSSAVAGGIGRLTQIAGKAENIESFSQQFAREAEAYATQRTGADLSVGAAQVAKTSLEQETLSSAANLEKYLKFQDPVLRLSNNPSVEARRTVQELAEVPLTTKKNEEGIASAVPVESMIAQHDANLDLLNLDIYDLFMTHRKGRKARTGDLAITGIGDLIRKPTAGRITFTDFRNEIGKAMARNDTHEIPEVAQAAKLYRERIFDPLKNQAIDLGLLPPDVDPKTAASYVSRLYNRNKIIAQRPEFERRIAQWLRGTNQNITENFTHWKKQQEIADGIIQEQKERLAELNDQISQVAPKVKRFRDRGKALDRDVMVLRQEAGKARTRANKAQERAEKLTPAERQLEFSRALRDVRSGIPKGRRPMSIVELLRSKRVGTKESRGRSMQINTFGLRDEGGELQRIVDKNPQLARIINNKSGHAIDDFGEILQELGYFRERPTTDEIINAIDDEISTGNKRYPEAEEGFQAYEEYVADLAEELERRDIDITKLPDEVIQQKLAQAADDATQPVPDNVKTRARSREAALGARRATRDAEDIEAKLSKKERELAEVTDNKGITSRELRELQAQAKDAKHILEVNTKKAEYFGKKAEDVHYIAGASDDDLLYIAQDITDGLIGGPPGRLPYEGVPVTRGPLNERTLLIPDEQIEDFLDRDIFNISRFYNKTMGADIELTKTFGQATMKDKIADIKEDYRLQRGDAVREAGLDPDNIDELGEIPEELQKKLTAINKAEKETIRDVEGIRDRLRGTYGIPDDPEALISRAYRVAKGVNYLRLLGGMTLSAMPDVARPIMVHGITRSFKDGLIPMVKNFRQFKLQANEAKIAGTALDMINNDRALAISNLDDAWMYTSGFERGLTAMQDNFKFVSLMAPWNSAVKQFSSLLSQNRSIEMIQALAKGDTLKAGEVTRLAKYGIDKPMAERMAKQIKRHSTNEDGIWWANTQAWDDRGAVDTYRAALKQEVDKIIVTPGQDKPLFMSREAGSVIMQFKTFALASTQRMLLSGLQQRDMAAMNGFMLSMMLGMGAYWSKTDESRLSDDPAKWVVEGIDRSGSMAWFMEANNMMEKITGFGINPMLGQQRATRYASRNAAEAMFGPTYGTVFGTIIPLIAGITSGEMTAKDVQKMRQMLPYQNVFYIRKMLDELEKGVASSAGLE